MQLDEFFNYKNQFMKDILTVPDIVRLINDDKTVASAHELIYTQVFPYEYIPDTAEHGKTYICVDIDIQRSESSKTFYRPVIYVWVFTHRSLMRLPEGGVRVDRLCSEICKRINGSKYYGLGELKIFSTKRFAPMTDYNGKFMVFDAYDFSRVYDPKKPIPARRPAIRPPSTSGTE